MIADIVEFRLRKVDRQFRSGRNAFPIQEVSSPFSITRIGSSQSLTSERLISELLPQRLSCPKRVSR